VAIAKNASVATSLTLLWPLDSSGDESLEKNLRLRMARRRHLLTGIAVPQSGIYTVTHAAHRLPTQVALLKGEIFPGCSKYRAVVGFELVRSMPGLDMLVVGLSIPFAFTELPVISDDTG
jgi:hypothetical protein